MAEVPRKLIATLSLSAAGFVGILLHEGYTGGAVIPTPGDVPTIGFGTTEGVKMGDTITPPKAVARALTDVSKYERAIKGCITVPLHQHEYDTWVDFAYNVGPARFCRSSTAAKLNAGDYAGACAEITEQWYRGAGRADCRDPANNCRGILIRRQAQRDKCEGK